MKLPNTLKKPQLKPWLLDKYCQALYDVYIGPSLNQWEEEVEQDEKVMDRIKKREERNKAKPNKGMWCRMCGGACDLDNCGMEQL